VELAVMKGEAEAMLVAEREEVAKANARADNIDAELRATQSTLSGLRVEFNIMNGVKEKVEKKRRELGEAKKLLVAEVLAQRKKNEAAGSRITDLEGEIAALKAEHAWELRTRRREQEAAAAARMEGGADRLRMGMGSPFPTPFRSGRDREQEARDEASMGADVPDLTPPRAGGRGGRASPAKSQLTTSLSSGSSGSGSGGGSGGSTDSDLSRVPSIDGKGGWKGQAEGEVVVVEGAEARGGGEEEAEEDALAAPLSIRTPSKPQSARAITVASPHGPPKKVRQEEGRAKPQRGGSLMTYKTRSWSTIMRVAGSAASAMRKPQKVNRVRNDEA
jgi:hypothetical protein